MSSATEPKFRPYFSKPELTKLISHLKRYPSPEMKGIMQYLETFTIKINHGIIQSSAEIKKPIAEILALDNNIPAALANQEKLFNKWRLAPEACTVSEIEEVQDYRYTHDLMNQQEEIDYEVSKGLV